MAFDGSGTFNRLYNWVTDKLNGVSITASRMDAETDGIAAGLTNCVTRDGQGKMGAHFTPSAADTYDVGSSGVPWRNVWADTGSFKDNGGTFQTVGWRDLPPNAQTGNYTLTLADRGKSVIFGGAGGYTCTIPANATTAFPQGTAITIINNCTTAITIAIPGTDFLYLAGSTLGGAGVSRTLAGGATTVGIATIIKVTATTAWAISGPGVT